LQRTNNKLKISKWPPAHEASASFTERHCYTACQAQAGSRLARAQVDATHALRGRGADDAPRLQLLKLLLPSTSCAEVENGVVL